MSERQGSSRRQVPGTWQRLPYGPVREQRGRVQARETRRPGLRTGPVLGSLSAASVLVALVAGRLGV
jgi:hypothetical protein